MMELPIFLIKGKIAFISGVFPLLDIHKTISPFWTFPKSPCIASAACKNTAGCPVELKVATILFAILALLPIPATIKRPLTFIIRSITATKSSLMLFSKF